MFTYLVLGSFALSLQIFYAQFKIGLLLPSRECFNGNLKVSDFGLSTLSEQIKNVLFDIACGTLTYTSPEIHYRQNYEGPKADEWSFGFILFVLLAGHLSFNNFNISTSLVHVLPDACASLADCQVASMHLWKDFPFAGLVTLIGTLLTLFIFTGKLARRTPLLVATVAALAIARCMHQ